jgi:hypothetical protein
MHRMIESFDDINLASKVHVFARVDTITRTKAVYSKKKRCRSYISRVDACRAYIACTADCMGRNVS